MTMTAKTITLIVSTNGPTIQQQLEAMQDQWLLERTLHTAAEFERQMQEINRVMEDDTTRGPKEGREG